MAAHLVHRPADGAADGGADLLSSADGWSTYDTFFGGGMISSVIKHDRMDDASTVLRRADLALGRARERVASARRAVADVGVALATREGATQRELHDLAAAKEALVGG